MRKHECKVVSLLGLCLSCSLLRQSFLCSREKNVAILAAFLARVLFTTGDMQNSMAAIPLGKFIPKKRKIIHHGHETLLNLGFCQSVYYFAFILYTSSCFTACTFTMPTKVLLWSVLHNMDKAAQWLSLCPVNQLSQSRRKKWYKHGFTSRPARMSNPSSNLTGIIQRNAFFRLQLNHTI